MLDTVVVPSIKLIVDIRTILVRRRLSKIDVAAHDLGR